MEIHGNLWKWKRNCWKLQNFFNPPKQIPSNTFRMDRTKEKNQKAPNGAVLRQNSLLWTNKVCKWHSKNEWCGVWTWHKYKTSSCWAGELSILLLEVGLALLGVGLHGIGSRLPASRADLTVLVRELERLHQTQRLIHGAADRQIVDGDLAQVTLVVNDEQTSAKDDKNHI